MSIQLFLFSRHSFQLFDKLPPAVDYTLRMESYHIEELCEHSRKGDLESIRRLLNEHRSDFNNRRMRRALERPLFTAATCGHPEIVRFFENNGVSTTWKDNSGWARIHFAARNGYTETVKVLAKKKANLNAKGKYKVKNC
ncbi:unnamed protein product [Enterobius vermicularis]|uniref:ANK_REP_REGION domain-containing protein n=1 Tax=Enterobius vermicularis TaxID=51028 RepID=A0A0N4UTM4_ENTVE|nr:unnamed protein product [Enterobius vermicularis]